ncbi:hypothetical protein [Streptomyces sp. NBC_00687]|uniref:hypothetical protein n=1 Tax=Streptomyces sp. NBC_00687 TaxID=2975807 RepID=UPI00225AB348|nr:hypothetical protein [Streptomyces sp. NBC_00687]MCX4920030.1 hypothetical protein [Streptomyces sp. NBC_00687]
MRSLRPPRSASPASGVLRGTRAGALAVLCVLLPLAGHVLSRGHAPGWVIVAAVAAVAVPGATFLTRRRLTDAQLFGVLAAAQLAYHVAYFLPGACAAAGSPGGSSIPWLEHGTLSGPPPEVLLGGHLVTLLLTARLLGVTERLLWQSKPLLAAVRRLLLLVWPLLGRLYGTGPQQKAVRESTVPLRSALVARLNEGRAPPRLMPSLASPLRPVPIGGPILP